MAVPWIPSPWRAVDALGRLLGIGSHDVVLDLGCGDGRVLVELARIYRARGVCIEIDRVLSNIAEIRARLDGVGDRIRVIRGDFFKVNLSEIEPRPTIVYAYLFPSILEELAPKLARELMCGTIVVSLDFAIRSWSPIFAKAFVDENGFDRILWIYVVGLSDPEHRRPGLTNHWHQIARNFTIRRMDISLHYLE